MSTATAVLGPPPSAELAAAMVRWCWAGNPHTWLGCSASAGGRA